MSRWLYISYSLRGLVFGWAVPLRIIPILQYIGLKTLCGKGGVYLACVGLSPCLAYIPIGLNLDNVARWYGLTFACCRGL